MENADLTQALDNIAAHLKHLGWGDAAPIKKGAIEDLSEHIKTAGESIAYALDHVAEAIDGLTASLENSPRITGVSGK